MSRLSAVAFVFWLALILPGPGFSAGVAPVNLRCDGWQNPLGIDNPFPHLSWQLAATNPAARSQFQTAYEIQAASSSALLASNRPDLWDSGEVTASLANHVAYAGGTLASARQVFWQVRVWDGAGSVSPWSAVATWTMGLLNPANWLGGWLVPTNANTGFSLSGCNWIWYPEGSPAQSAPVAARYFLKSFSWRTNSALVSATLLVTADNGYTAYVNGEEVAQGQDYTTVIPVDVIDQLVAGTNLLAIAATNSGGASNPAGLFGKLVLGFADGTQTNIPMDATWKTANTLQTNWQSPGFNDSSWTNALVLGAYGISPWGTGVSIQSSQTGLPVYLRQFTVNPGLQRAFICICGLGQYELSANGMKVGNACLAPGWTKYDQTCLYDTLDLTAVLTNGNNSIGVMLGNGMYNVLATTNYTKFTGSFGQPMLMAQLYLFYTNGTSQIIASDTNWFAASGPITYSQVYGGETYDARLIATNWNQAGFDASGWPAAIVTNGPGGTLRGTSHAAPPIIATETLLPVRTNILSSTTAVYDFGQNAAIMATLTAHGPAGAMIQITPAELTNSDGTINRNSAGGGTAFWQYTLAGTGEENWTSRFYYHGCRYVQVTLTPADGSTTLPTLDSLGGVVIQSASANVGSFACSSALFNSTRTMIQWAQRNNLISILTDCPHRERLGWLEQDNLNGPSLRYESDLGLLFAKAEQDMADSQTDAGTGLVPNIAPEFTVFSGGYRDSPEWGSSVILVPWQQYLFTGDDTLLRNYYYAMTNYFGYLQKQATNDFLNYPNGLGDWYDIGPNAPGYSQDTPISLTADFYYCLDAQLLGQIAAELGNTNDAARFNLLATNIGQAFNSSYYSAANGDYSTGSQTAQAMPLYLGIVSPANQASVMTELVSNIYARGLTAGEIGHRYLLRALTDMGRPDVVSDLHSGTNNPGYGYILSRGATALTEAWDADPSDSQDHFMLGHITEWFYHDLAGIQYDPAAPGFQNVVIKPSFLSGISWANATFVSGRGPVGSSWTLANSQAALNVTIPAGSTGSIYLPILGSVTTNLLIQESGTTIYQNNAATNAAAGVTFSQVVITNTQTFVVWKVGSGSYQFTWNVLGIPGGLTATAGNGVVQLAWNPVAGATGYVVARSTSSATGYATLAADVTTTNYTDLFVTNNTTYYYVVATLSGSTQGSNSAPVSATPGFVANFGFETPVTGSYQYNPSGGGWTFTVKSGAIGSGISANGSAFTSGNPAAPQGNQVAFLQGTASISQTIVGLIAGAIYQVTFAAAQRNNVYGQQTGQSWQLQLNGITIGTYAPPESFQTYANYGATFTAPAVAAPVLGFVGTNTNGGDNTVFLDNVQITLAPSLVPPKLVCQVATGQIQLTWPADHAGWRLQMQMNPLNLGLGTNWVTVPGSTLTNEMVSSLAQGGGCAFFRLVYP